VEINSSRGKEIDGNFLVVQKWVAAKGNARALERYELLKFWVFFRIHFVRARYI
jgi:hypothetical protein